MRYYRDDLFFINAGIMNEIHQMIRRIIEICFFTILVPAICASAQAQLPLPEDYLTKEFHAGRREALRRLMPDNSVTVVFASPERNYANDVNYKYHPDPDLYYFSGYTEPDAVLLVFKEARRTTNGASYNELLFVQKKNPNAEQWTGVRLGVEGAKAQLGFAFAFNGEEFGDFPLDLTTYNKVIFEYPRDLAKSGKKGGIYDLVKSFNKKTGISDEAVLPKRADRNLFRSLTSQLRQIKTPEEIVLMRKAIDISCLAHNEAMKAVSPASSELELQGVQEFIHKKMGAQQVGYPSIVGAGNNGCVLHYIDNKVTRAGNNLVLMDVGAEYHGYTADVTRTFPANGKFSAEQRAIYDIVYEAQEAVFRICREGTSFEMIEAAARMVVSKGLLKLGIIKKEQENLLYYPHGCSHFLGLDVHDKGIYDKLKENMVITVEPGIYIPEGSNCDPKWWGIAVRIEDDVLVGRENAEILSHLAPRSAVEVEKMVSRKSFTEGLILPAVPVKK